MSVLRFLGLGKESTYGTKVAPQFYMDIASSSLDTPDEPEIIHPGGLTRFKRIHKPGVYIPTGGVECIADIDTLWYLLLLLLGANTTTDNTSSTAAEAIGTTNSNGDLDFTSANQPIVPGTISIKDSSPAEVATDDGNGNLTGTASGTVDYDTGDITLRGSTPSDAHTADYDNGTYEHIITPVTTLDTLSSTMKLGKDEFMHTFTGCVLNSIGINVEREWCQATLDVIAQKDEKETIPSLATVKADLPQGYPIPFHKVTAKAIDYGGTLADISADVEKVAITIETAADGEGGVTIGSRHPRRVWGGEFAVKVDMSLVFDGTEELEDFWGGASAPAAGGTQEKTLQVTLTGGTNLGTVVFDFYKAITTSLSIQPSGRDRIVQEVSFEVLYDDIEDLLMKATCTSVQTFDIT